MIFKKVKREILISVLLTGIGVLLLAINNGLYAKILGALFTVAGAIIAYVVNSYESTRHKMEMIQRIDDFKNELQTIKSETISIESTEKIKLIENEFNNWAKEFNDNYVQKKLELATSNLDYQKIKIELSKDYRYIYEAFLRILKMLVTAYNTSNASKIEILKDMDLPYNFYSKEAVEFYWKIKFTNRHFWYVLLDVIEPIDGKTLPSIILDAESNELKDTNLSRLRGSNFTIDINNNQIHIYNRFTFRRFKMDGSHPIVDYETVFKTTLKRMLELQILTQSEE